VLGFFHFLDQMAPGSTLDILTDNTTALSVLRRYGSRLAPLGRAMEPLLQLVVQRRLVLQARHIPGEQNTAADFLSRVSSTPDNSWSLRWATAAWLLARWATQFSPTIDFFASDSHHLHHRFCSVVMNHTRKRRWVSRPCRDAFSMVWENEQPWVTPPINLINRVVGRFLDDRPTASVWITPYWPTRAWFAVLRGLARDLILLPTSAIMTPMTTRATLQIDGLLIRWVAWLL
jgi:hypothetical protein